jgi:hypothetical protein
MEGVSKEIYYMGMQKEHTLYFAIQERGLSDA